MIGVVLLLLSLDPPHEFMRSLYAHGAGEPDPGAGAGFSLLTFLRLVQDLLRDRRLAGGRRAAAWAVWVR